MLYRSLIVLGLFSTLIAFPPLALGLEITGTVYDLPNPTLNPIKTRQVVIRVFSPLEQAGELVRDANGALVNGTPIASGTSDITSGQYKVDGIPGGTRVVIIEYNRSGEAVTQRLEGLVLSDEAPNQFDVTVPKEVCPVPGVPYHSDEVHSFTCQPCHLGFLGRLKRRLWRCR